MPIAIDKFAKLNASPLYLPKVKSYNRGLDKVYCLHNSYLVGSLVSLFTQF
nr:MAG TPA: hypothetical protein [Caudoviricetes sp.]